MERMTFCGISCNFYRLHELNLLPDVAKRESIVLDEKGKPFNAGNDMGVAMLPNGVLVWIDEVMQISSDGYKACAQYINDTYVQPKTDAYWKERRDKLVESFFESHRDDTVESMFYIGRYRYGLGDRRYSSYVVPSGDMS